MALTGHVIGGPADYDYDGATLTADLAIGDTVLHVDDVADFDEDASKRDAQLLIDPDFDTDGDLVDGSATPLAYDTCDDDDSTITLAAPSTVAAATGDRVYLLDPVSAYPVGRIEVLVALDDSDTTGDPLPAYVDTALLESVGDVDLDDLAVELEEDDDGQLYVSGFPGLTRRQGGVKFMQDKLTVTATGDQILHLTYRPVKNSEHLYWNGLYQQGDSWSRDQWTVSIPDPDDLVEVDDELVMEYAYRDPTTKPPIPASLTLVGSGHVTNGASSIDLPAGTQSGDLIALAMISRSSTACSVTDARIVDSHASTNPGGTATASMWVGYGFEDGSGAAVPLSMPAGITGDSRAVIVTFRVTGALSDVYTALRSRDGDGGSFSPPMPDAERGIALLVGESNIVSGAWNNDLTGEWTTVAPTVDSGATGHSAVLIAYCTEGAPDGIWTGFDSGACWGALTIGLNEETF